MGARRRDSRVFFGRRHARTWHTPARLYEPLGSAPTGVPAGGGGAFCICLRLRHDEDATGVVVRKTRPGDADAAPPGHPDAGVPVAVAAGREGRRAHRRRVGARLQGRVPDPGRERELLPRVREVRAGGAEVLGRGVHRAGHDLFGAAEGDAAAGGHGRGGRDRQDQRPKNIIEKEVYLGELPILTPLGTFVINGAERVIVSQLHRSPGVVFEESIHPNGQRLFSARIIPFRGSWVEFTVDIHDVIYVHIDKKKKFPATALLRAFGYGTNAEILKLFYATKDIDITGKLEGRAQRREVLGTLLAVDVPDPENKKGEPLALVGDELTQERFNTFRRAGLTKVKVFAGYTGLDLRDDAQPTTTRERQGPHVLAFDVADPGTGEVLADGGKELSETLKRKLLKAGLTKVDVLLPAGRSESPLIKNTLLKDPTRSEAEALEQIYALLRPGEAPNLETARQALERLFFHPKRDRKSTRLNSSHGYISYAVFCLKKKKHIDSMTVLQRREDKDKQNTYAVAI